MNNQSKHKTLYEWCLENNKPNLLIEYDLLKNAENPSDIYSMSRKKVWWKCSKGHEWESIVSNRTNLGRNCPICSNQKILKGFNDLSTVNPFLAKEWDYIKNDPLTPNDVGAFSKKKVWWKCSNKHSWYAEIKSRNYGVGCPYCKNKKISIGFNDLATTHPNLLKEWDYEYNKQLKPTDVTYGSGKKVWWICDNKHHYKMAIDQKTKGNNCPYCLKSIRSSFPEQCIFYYIKKEFSDAINGYKDIFDNKKMELDVYIPSLKVGIEYDGKLYHSKTDNILRDRKKYEICKEHGIILIRIKEMYDGSFLHTIEDHKIDIFKADSQWLNYAINNLCYHLGKIVDVNIDRDRNEILSLLDKRKTNLLSKYPLIAKEWNYEKNIPLVPENFSPHSNRKVYWKCKICGYEWEASIGDRTRKDKTGCPNCWKNRRKKVKCIETNKIYDSADIAADELNINKKMIQNVCSGWK